MSYGTVTAVASQVAERLRSQGQSVSLVSVHTVKPLDEKGIVEALARHGKVIVIEETGPTGSLGRRVKELAWESQARCKIATFGLQDEFIHCYGSHGDLLAEHGIATDKILAHIEHL
jgi:transketolase